MLKHREGASHHVFSWEKTWWLVFSWLSFHGKRQPWQEKCKCQEKRLYMAFWCQRLESCWTHGVHKVNQGTNAWFSLLKQRYPSGIPGLMLYKTILDILPWDIMTSYNHSASCLGGRGESHLDKSTVVCLKVISELVSNVRSGQALPLWFIECVY